MRKILPVALIVASMGAFVQSGLAADIPARMGRVAPLTTPISPAFSWTGCYIGGNAGYGWSPKDWDFFVPGTVLDGSHDATGVVAGGQVGCDLQTGNFVFGVEGMFDWAGMDGSHTVNVLGADLHHKTELSWVASVTGRAGFAVDRALFYVKGGVAWVDEDYSITGPGGTASANDVTNTGWTVGGGVEWAFAPNWSAKLEYNYMDFGSENPRFCINGTCGRDFDIEQNIHLVTVGLNYRFNFR